MALDENVKLEWLAALRSGEYPQDGGKLKTEEGYCCLGVLCDVGKKLFGVAGEWEQPEFEDDSWYFVGTKPHGKEVVPDARSSFLPSNVIGWAGITTTQERILSKINDNADDFADVIDYIEKNL